MPSVGNLVIQATIGTGTGNLTLTSLSAGSPPYFYRNFATVFGTGAGNTFYYCIRHQSAAEFEVGIGYMSDATTLVRSSVLESSNANALVSFSAGTKDVICDMPAAYQQTKPIQHGGTNASTEDGAIFNIVGNSSPISVSDVSLAYVPVYDADGSQAGNMSIDGMLGTWFMGLGLSNYQMTYYFNGALLGITPSATVGLPMASNGSGVASSFQKIPTKAIKNDIATYTLAGGL